MNTQANKPGHSFQKMLETLAKIHFINANVKFKVITTVNMVNKKHITFSILLISNKRKPEGW